MFYDLILYMALLLIIGVSSFKCLNFEAWITKSYKLVSKICWWDKKQKHLRKRFWNLGVFFSNVSKYLFIVTIFVYHYHTCQSACYIWRWLPYLFINILYLVIIGIFLVVTILYLVMIAIFVVITMLYLVILLYSVIV